MRFAALSIVVLACPVAPRSAAAHSRAPTVALDYRLELVPATPPGVDADVVDGDGALRVRVELVGGALGMFWHGVVVSSLTRLATAVAFVGGAAAVALAAPASGGARL